MALVRRGSRLIAVDGAEYRWRVRPRPTYCQGMGWSALTFAVERVHEADGVPGTVLVVDVGAARPDNWLGRPSMSVLPSTVAAAVRLALAGGWEPERPGRPFLVGPQEWAARGPAADGPAVPGAA
ncbi:hypothetical protein [Peterkaempfera griseoplana]|uniref:hypothetical protein n=1 Tax=Peterkaempfera griseoplana TaxID=66896 RepID=UPI0006E2D295|nr:hypothetical protein [Peterkaempfera griseoplana]